MPAIAVSGSTLGGSRVFGTVTASATYYYAFYLYANDTGYAEHGSSGRGAGDILF